MSVEPFKIGRTAGRMLSYLAWRLVPAAPFLIVLLIWIVLWEVFRPSKETLPPVRDVVSAIHDLAVSGMLAQNVTASLGRLVLGSLIGIVTGVAAGFVVGLNRNVAEMFNPLVVFFNAISGIVWLPLMITWLGIGTAACRIPDLEYGVLHRISEHRARRAIGAGSA